MSYVSFDDCGCDCDNNYRRVRMFARAEEGAAIVSCRVGGTKRGERSQGAGVRKEVWGVWATE